MFGLSVPTSDVTVVTDHAESGVNVELIQQEESHFAFCFHSSFCVACTRVFEEAQREREREERERERERPEPEVTENIPFNSAE